MLAPPRLRVGRGRPQRAAELDEMWRFVDAKENARWLWHALDHHTGRVLAYVVGARKEAVFLTLHAGSAIQVSLLLECLARTS